jgi:hypothetical protein
MARSAVDAIILITLCWHSILLFINTYVFGLRGRERRDKWGVAETDSQGHSLRMHVLVIAFLLIFVCSLLVTFMQLRGLLPSENMEHIEVVWMFFMPLGWHSVLHSWIYAVQKMALRLANTTTPRLREPESYIWRWRLTVSGIVVYILCACICLPLAVLQGSMYFLLVPLAWNVLSVVIARHLLYLAVTPFFNLAADITKTSSGTMKMIQSRIVFFRRSVVLCTICLMLIILLCLVFGVQLFTASLQLTRRARVVLFVEEYCVFANIINAFCTFAMCSGDLSKLSHRRHGSHLNKREVTELSPSTDARVLDRQMPNVLDVLHKSPVTRNSAVKIEHIELGTDDDTRSNLRNILASPFRKQRELKRDHAIRRVSQSLDIHDPNSGLSGVSGDILLNASLAITEDVALRFVQKRPPKICTARPPGPTCFSYDLQSPSEEVGEGDRSTVFSYNLSSPTTTPSP